MNDSIFDEAKEQVEKILSLLKEGTNYFPKHLVPKALLEQGYTIYKGVITPKKSVSHRYLYDEYEDPFVKSYIVLFEKLIEERASITNEFSFRTLLEMGCENSFLILNKKVESDDRKLFLLTTSLTNYSAIETEMRQVFAGWFSELYKENKEFLVSKLSEKVVKTFDELDVILKQSNLDLDRYTILLIKARRIISSVKANLLTKYRTNKIFEFNDMYKRMKSGEADTIHGNVFLITNRINQQSQENHLFRVFSYLTISGRDMLTHLDSFLNNKKFSEDIESFNKEHDEFKKKFLDAWQKCEKIK